MAQVIVRNLDDAVVQALKAKAELHGRALEQELREILIQASGLSPEDKLELVNRIRGMAPAPVGRDSAELIREDRDNR
jgi:plasmid stability protein